MLQANDILLQHRQAVEEVCRMAVGYVERLEFSPFPPTTTIRMRYGVSVKVTTTMETTDKGFVFITRAEGPEGLSLLILSRGEP